MFGTNSFTFYAIDVFFQSNSNNKKYVYVFGQNCLFLKNNHLPQTDKQTSERGKPKRFVCSFHYYPVV